MRIISNRIINIFTKKKYHYSTFLIISIILLHHPIPTKSSSSYYGSSISIATEYNHNTISKPTFLIRNKHKLRDDNGITKTSLVSSSKSIQRNDIFDEEKDLPSIEEMRASLGPIGRTIASAVEVGVVTAGSYISGAILGYTIGGFMAVPSLFQKSDITPAKGPIGTWHNKASTQAMNWATLSAAFSGFHALSRVVRNKEDKWNGIIGSAATGAFLNRKGGPRAMAQGGISYASVTYLLDFAFGVSNSNKVSTNSNNGADSTTSSPEFEFTDAPYEE